MSKTEEWAVVGDTRDGGNDIRIVGEVWKGSNHDWAKRINARLNKLAVKREVAEALAEALKSILEDNVHILDSRNECVRGCSDESKTECIKEVAKEALRAYSSTLQEGTTK